MATTEWSASGVGQAAPAAAPAFPYAAPIVTPETGTPGSLRVTIDSGVQATLNNAIEFTIEISTAASFNVIADTASPVQSEGAWDEDDEQMFVLFHDLVPGGTYYARASAEIL
jgi:hypothetical protein